jgi:short-subunit dehydrogenase
MATAEGKAPANYTPENIQGKCAIVTGGTTGIGRATARLLAERGAKVLIFGRHQEELDEALQHIRAGGGEVSGIIADSSQVEDVLRVFQEADRQLGRVDILVNNAAVSAGSVLEKELPEIQYGLMVNIFGYMACTHEAIARMKAQGGGHIVNIGSMSADLREEENDVYVATKAAIQAFSQSLRKLANPQGIKISLVEPGLIATPMTDSPDRDQEQELANQKMLQPEDIAEAVHYVLTQPARCDVVQVQIRPHGQTI